VQEGDNRSEETHFMGVTVETTTQLLGFSLEESVKRTNVSFFYGFQYKDNTRGPGFYISYDANEEVRVKLVWTSCESVETQLHSLLLGRYERLRGQNARIHLD